MSEEVKQEGDFKMKKKPGRPKKLNKTEDNTTKVDFKKQEEEAIQQKEKEIQDAVQESSAKKVDVDATSGDGEKVGETHAEKQETTQEAEEIKEEKKEKEVVIIEAKEEETTEETVEQIKEEIKEKPQLELPENIEKLVEFMQDTGGSVEDYVRLNADYANLNNEQLLREYYKATKPHLNSEEVTFIMEDKFAYDEEEDDSRTVKKKQLALKEEIAKAYNFLEDTKEQYYEEIKMRPSANSEMTKATEFFNRYNEEQKVRKQRFDVFQNNTKDYFQNHEGFDFDLGDKAVKYKLNNTDNVAEAQSDLNNLVKKFLNKNGEIADYKGYHKAIYAARNPDSLARHFYEQGKADGIKDVMGKSANIDKTRPNPGDVKIGGYKIRAISGDDSSKLKIKKYRQ